MAQTKVVLDRDAIAQVFPFGTTAAAGDALVTINKGTLAATAVVLDVKASANIAGDLNLTGDLNVTGSVNSTSVTNTNVKDLTITLNDGGTTAGAAGSGILIEGTTNTVIGAIKYDGTLASKFTIGDGTTQVQIADISSAQTLTNKVIGGGQITGNITGNAANVTGIVLVANGGTGAATLTGYVKGNGTATMTASATITGADISGNITGNAANVTGTVLIANGGTGATTAQGAINATNPHTTLGDMSYRDANNVVRLAGNITGAKQFLVQTGTGAVSAAPVWGTIVAGDVPTLNQNTTGTASNVTGIVVVANGGTGLATLAANAVMLGNGTGTPLFVAAGISGNVLTSNGTTWVSSAAGAATTTKEVAVSGTQDGVNKTFTLANAVTAGSAIVVVNGVVRRSGSTNDFLISGTTLTFQADFTAPAANTVILVYGAY